MGGQGGRDGGMEGRSGGLEGSDGGSALMYTDGCGGRVHVEPHTDRYSRETLVSNKSMNVHVLETH